MEKESIIKLTENFFKNLKCETIWENSLLLVHKVPNDFEKLYEKSSPYIFSFDEETSRNNPDSELITKGSLILKLMAVYLDNKAQTTILKIDFNPDLNEIIKNNIDFKNYEVVDLNRNIKNDYIFRFTFLTTLQYFNDKEQIITSIYLNNNQLLNDFNIDDYPSISGKKEDTKKELLDEIKSNYAVARENLKLKLHNKTREVSLSLNKSLERALDRLNSHYNHQIMEIKKQNENNIENLKNSKMKLEKTKEKNKQIIIDRINRLEEAIKNSRINEEIEKLEKEKQFFLNDEKHKHSINLNSSIMNTTVIYFPIFEFKIQIKTKDHKPKELTFTYHPLKKELSKIYCESCNSEINEIFLCESNNHLACSNCLTICPRCGKKVCKSCRQLSCNICGGEICEKCATLCNVCKKYICNSDTRKDNLSPGNICSNCSDFCSSCSKFSDKKTFRNCDSCRTKVCRKCIRSKIVNGKSMSLCNDCYSKINSKPVFSL